MYPQMPADVPNHLVPVALAGWITTVFTEAEGMPSAVPYGVTSTRLPFRPA